MQLTIYYKEDDQWLVEKIEAKAYGDRKSVSQVILTILDGYFAERGTDETRPKTPTPRKKPGPKPGSKRKKKTKKS